MLSFSNLQENLARDARKASVTRLSKNFHGCEEIRLEENSTVIVKNEHAETSSQGRWSSDIMNDETLNFLNSCRMNDAATKKMVDSSGFNEQNHNRK